MTLVVLVVRRREHLGGDVALEIGDFLRPLVDEKGDEVPIGEAGEIIVRAPNVMKGYLNKPEATAEAIRNGWYHSSDVAVRNKDGYITIVDRMKDMIISGGENIYTTEVENLLMRFTGILEATVIGGPDPKWGEVVRAFVVMKPGETGLCLFEGEDGHLAVVPPFPITADYEADAFEPGPLIDLLSKDRTVLVVLVRLGHYSVGLLDGDRVVASKSGTRHVKNRHRKGGSSQRRFERSRGRRWNRDLLVGRCFRRSPCAPVRVAGSNAYYCLAPTPRDQQ